jgi:UDP-N-acetylmuramoylalanine--D-glutamate ligase
MGYHIPQDSLSDQKRADSYMEFHSQENGMNSKKQIPCKPLHLMGDHNIANVLASLSILEQLNIKISKSVEKALFCYKGLSHRFERISRRFHCDWINDSKATNVGATLAAFAHFKKDDFLILIAGGDAKGSDLMPLKMVFEQKLNGLIVIGKDAKRLANITSKIPIFFAANMLKAVERASLWIQQQKADDFSYSAVLLSPACSSLDMFLNFKERGNAFSQAIEKQGAIK